MSDELLDDAIAALRDVGDAADGGDATRARLVRSLEVRGRRHRQLVSAATIAAVLAVGGVSWAWSTGRLQALLSPSAPAPHEEAPSEPAPPHVPMQLPVPRVQHASAVPALPPEPPPEVEAPPAPPPPPAAPVPVVKRAPFEPLYRKAHELHFHGSDPAAALAAWDAYLAAEPNGRFAIEARFNRALVLVKLGRYAEARAALEPFARGELAYRQAEAAELAERLAQLAGD
jgi:hypothetical protein